MPNSVVDDLISVTRVMITPCIRSMRQHSEVMKSSVGRWTYCGRITWLNILPGMLELYTQL